MIWRSTLFPAGRPNKVSFRRVIGAALVPLIWYWRTVRPARNSALPALDTQVNVALLLAEAIRSAMRPPQPEVADASSCDDCHIDCWSLCENRRGGSATAPALYCASVVGCTRV